MWGHNHRGQLGGVEGAKVKLPIGCESLAGLRPVQLIGGEQTLFAVTADGKVIQILILEIVYLEDLLERKVRIIVVKVTYSCLSPAHFFIITVYGLWLLQTLSVCLSVCVCVCPAFTACYGSDFDQTW